MFRLIHHTSCTVGIDEAERYHNPRDLGMQQIRQLLNSGYKAGMPAIRLIGDDMKPQAFDVYPLGYNGTGLFVSNAARGQVKTVMLDSPVDLRAAFYPHLTFWQRGQISTTDIAAVDISTDGGQSWAVIDLTSRVAGEWMLTDIDLTPFAGQIISIRIRVDATQPMLDGVTSAGVWIDELAIQEIPPAPTVEPAALDTLPAE